MRCKQMVTYFIGYIFWAFISRLGQSSRSGETSVQKALSHDLLDAEVSSHQLAAYYIVRVVFHIFRNMRFLDTQEQEERTASHVEISDERRRFKATSTVFLLPSVLAYESSKLVYEWIERTSHAGAKEALKHEKRWKKWHRPSILPRTLKCIHGRFCWIKLHRQFFLIGKVFSRFL